MGCIGAAAVREPFDEVGTPVNLPESVFDAGDYEVPNHVASYPSVTAVCPIIARSQQSIEKGGTRWCGSSVLYSKESLRCASTNVYYPPR